MKLLNEDFLHIFLKEKIYITEKFETPSFSTQSESAVETEKVSKQPFVFEEYGHFDKKILIVLPAKGDKKEEELSFLYKILSACKLGENDWKIIEVDAEKTNFRDIIERFAPNITLFFGNFGEVYFGNKEIFSYFLQRISGSLILHADDLSALMLAPDKKKRLWQTLQIVPFQNF